MNNELTGKKWSREAYDELYAQLNMLSEPFGYAPDYLLWRQSKIKGEISRFIKKDGLILDVGGGFGMLVKFLPDYVNVDVNYINLDISTVMLKYSPYQNVCAGGEFLPFRENCFDYVICSEVLEHVSDKLMVLRECYRTLKPKGLLLLTTPRTGWIDDFKKSPFVIFLYLDYIFNKFVNRFKRSSSMFSIPEGVRDEPSDEKWLKVTLERIGFHVLKQWRSDNHVPWAKAGESKFWRWFADHFVNPRRFGHVTCWCALKIILKNLAS